MLMPMISASGAAEMPKLPMGMNLAKIADWEPGFPFRNLMWGARLWMTRNIDGSGKFDTGAIEQIQFDENGYPLELPIAIDGLDMPQVVFTILPNVRAPGRYVLLYDGTGDFEGIQCTRVISKSAGRVVLEMKHEGGNQENPSPEYEGICITRSSRDDHVRNIRIVPIADEKVDLEVDPFLPEFIDYCRPFHALRFMDWMATNNSLERDWPARKRRTFYTMVGAGGDADHFYGDSLATNQFMLSGGVALEVCIDLCNRLQIDAWFNVPHRATDEYIEEFARLVKRKLDPELRVYCEYSNELWNWGFVQSKWMLRSESAASPLEAIGMNPWLEKAARKGKDHPERIGVLFRHCYEIWERVFSGSDRRRLVTVCAVQHAWLDTARRTLKYCIEHGGVDVLSPGGYFGPSNIEYSNWTRLGDALTADQVIADLEAAFERDTSTWTKHMATLALSYKVDLAIYEGGQHVQPEGQKELSYMPALKEAQQHDGMYDLYIRNSQLHQEVGCKLFCAYNSVTRQGTRYGSWGQSAYYGQPLAETPKLRAVLDANTGPFGYRKGI
jgi:hypothetical protein